MHFLQQEIEFLPQFAGAVEKLSKLLQVTPQAVQFFADVASLCEQGSFLGEPRGLDTGAIQQFFEPRLQPAGEGWSERARQLANFFSLLGNARQTRAEILSEMAAF